jgi:hypothetical protein
MDRISTLRNVEEALSAFEDGELSLHELEREVMAVLRTYATDFAQDRHAYRAIGEPPADGVVVLAGSRVAARDRIVEIVGEEVRFEVERAGD